MNNANITLPIVDIHALATDSGHGVVFHADYPEICRLRPSPRFWLGAATPELAHWFYTDRCSPGCGIYQAANIRISGVEVIEQAGKFLSIPQNGVHPHSIINALTQQSIQDHPITAIDEPVVFLNGPAYQIYGHWLIDFLPRLLLLARRLHHWQRLKYLIPDDLPEFGHQWLDLLGIPADNIIKYQLRGHVYHLREAIIPTSLRNNGRPAPVLRFFHDFLRTTMAAHAPTNPAQTTSIPSRIYISRTKHGNMSRQFAEVEALEALFAARDFTIMHPETMPIPEQIALFDHATEIAGEYGSGLHNTIFSSPNTKVMVLRGNQGHPGFLQSDIGEIMDQPTGYVFGRTQESAGAQITQFALDDVRTGLDIAFSGVLW